MARDLEGGNLVATFPLATNDYVKHPNGTREEKTEWHNIVLWRTLAEYAVNHLRKGNTVMIEGKLRTRARETKTNGKQYITEIVADHIINLTPKKDGTGDNYPRPASGTPPTENKPETGARDVNDGMGDLS